jgi:hypothetical protein
MVCHHLSQHHLIWEIYFFATLKSNLAPDPGAFQFRGKFRISRSDLAKFALLSVN